MARIPGIDFLRTLALGLMIAYHFVYDLDQWTGIDIHVDSPFWFAVGKTAALLFMFLSGLSSGLSRHPVRNGLRLLAWGMIITLATWLFLPTDFVRFGILHFLGTLLLLSPLLHRIPNGLLPLLSVLAAGLGFYFNSLSGGPKGLLALGIMYPGFSSIDYYPLFPYSAVSLMGIFTFRLGLFANPQPPQDPLTPGNGAVSHPWTSLIRLPIFRQISRHSLRIYLLHQPIILFFLFLFQWFFEFSRPR